MTTYPLSARVGSLTWLLLQAVAIVASILLAFAIDAWWSQRVEAVEKNALLVSVKAELLNNRKRMDQDRVYRQAAMDSAKSLLKAVADARYEDPNKTLDHRLADLTWFSNEPLATGAVESLLLGGRVAAVEDDTLRQALADWPRRVATLSKLQNQDYETLMNVVTPFLARNASLAQISNEAYRHGRPGDGWGVTPEREVSVPGVTDHTPLLRNQEFSGMLVRKMWNDGDVVFVLDSYTNAIDELIRLIDQELERTS